MKSKLSRYAGTLFAVCALATTLIAPAAHSDSSFITKVSWSTLHAVIGDGVAEQDRNEFDSKGVKQVDSSSQHPTVWVRKDVLQVTVKYDGGATQANKQVQFIADNSGQSFTFSDNITDPKKIVNTDDKGVALVTYTVSGIESDSYLQVSIAGCDFLNAAASCPNAAKNPKADVVGPLMLTWEKAGYYPILRLDPSVSARNVYWDWSEFKNGWVGEMSQVYIKTYLVGSTIKLPYTVTDIWGGPIANYPITLVAQGQYCGGNIKCKWGKAPDQKSTDANGKVTFLAINKNTATEACKNIDPQTKKKCGIGANFQPTTNQIPESADIFWPQFVNDMTLKPTSISYRVLTRGGLAAPSGNDVTVNGVVNPALPLATSAVADSAIVKTVLNISYLYNAAKDALSRVPLYAPDVQVSASPGAYVLRVCPDTVNATDCLASGMLFSSEITSTSQMHITQTFGYTFPATLIFASTKAGPATFTVKVGGQSYVLKQTFASN